MVNPRAIRNAIKYGPVIAGAAKKYGPTLVEEARKHAPAVVEEVQRRSGRGAGASGASGAGAMADATPRESGSLLDKTPLGGAAARRRANAHARSVVEGTLLQTFHHSRPVWVVFSGDTPVGTHPHVDVSYTELLRHVDLAQRVRPRNAGPGPRPAGSAGTPGPAAGQTGRTPAAGEGLGPQDDEPLEGTVHP